MKRIIIDTDTGSDDAVALVMALRDKTARVEAVTTVFGNVSLQQATENALISIDMADTYAPPVYCGADRPLGGQTPVFRPGVHGKDGLGDVGYPAPTGRAQTENAVDAILRLLKENPNELEICTLGPLTNLAMAVLREPETVKLCRKITVMGGSFPEFTKWFTPVGEGNMIADPHAANIVLGCGVPIVMVPLNVCRGDTVLTAEDMAYQLQSGSPVARFCIDCNKTLIDLNERRFGVRCLDPADQTAVAACLHPETMAKTMTCHIEFETAGRLTNGAMVFYGEGNGPLPPNAKLCYQMDAAAFKQYMISHSM